MRKIHCLATTAKLQPPALRDIILPNQGVQNETSFSKEQDALGTSLCWCRERAWHSSEGEKKVMWGVAVQAQLAKAQAKTLQLFQTQTA